MAWRKRRQKYYPNEKQAKRNRRESARNAVTMRKRRGTQWGHGRKSKRQVRHS